MARRTSTALVPISEARRRLFELVDDVRTGRVDRIALSHRAHDETVVLVRARELEKLEAEVAGLRARVEPALWSLRGSIQLLVSPEEFEQNLARRRAHQAELFEAKMARIFAPSEPEDSDGPAAKPSTTCARA